MRVEQQIEYEAGSDAEAIQVARERLGREAVILSSRPVKLGGFLGFFRRDALWVTAGLLTPDAEDDAKESKERMVAFQHLLEVRRAVSGGAKEAEAPVTSAFTPDPRTTPAVAAAHAYESNSGERKPQVNPNAPLAKDVDEIKATLAKVLARLEGEAFGIVGEAREKPSGELGEEERRLMAVDVDREIAVEIGEEYREKTGGMESPTPFDAWLAGLVPTMGPDNTSSLGGRKVLFAGPTGVGKTTTIAKIAAGQSLWENRKVVLLTADTYRIAAVEQLRTYAKILGVPIEIAAEAKDIQAALKRHKDADLILLDTAGRSHYDGGRIDELHGLYDAFQPDAVHLVMAANVKYRDMLDIIERMGVVPLSALLFTKLDETSSYGTILNVLRDFDLPLSFLTMGQNVPNDIEIAKGDRFVDLLLKGAKVRE